MKYLSEFESSNTPPLYIYIYIIQYHQISIKSKISVLYFKFIAFPVNQQKSQGH